MKVALVTGGNKGIGYAIVRALSKALKEEGVVYLASRDEGRGQEAVQQLKGEGLQNVDFLQLDLLNNDHIDKAQKYLKEKHGGLDILVNNAAIAFKAAAPEPDTVQAPVTIETNVFATLRVCQALFPLLRSHGRVVNVASRGGTSTYSKLSPELQKRFKSVDTEQGVIDLMNEFISAVNAGEQKKRGWSTSNYGTSKLGLIALTRIQGQDIAKDTIRDDILINSCCPGYVDTDMSSHKGTLTIDQGAETPTYLALLPPGSKFQGQFFAEKKVYEY
ncbi:carbonyl reductase [NADPH] 1-like [Diadema setosum]|uniref:carbonyl reductase [NADPH] 1-like n=1 Tax=Diadema setosum TaxID=31175 RepID=UPI003B3A19F7